MAASSCTVAPIKTADNAHQSASVARQTHARDPQQHRLTDRPSSDNLAAPSASPALPRPCTRCPFHSLHLRPQPGSALGVQTLHWAQRCRFPGRPPSTHSHPLHQRPRGDGPAPPGADRRSPRTQPLRRSHYSRHCVHRCRGLAGCRVHCRPPALGPGPSGIFGCAQGRGTERRRRCDRRGSLDLGARPFRRKALRIAGGACGVVAGRGSHGG